MSLLARWRKKTAAVAAVFFLTLVSCRPCLGDEAVSRLDPAACESSAATRQLMLEMDRVINSDAPLTTYLDLFSPNIEAWGLVPEQAATWQGVENHYKPVFGNFDRSILVSDEVIVAGRFAAQRYHAMFYLTGEFDGVKAREKKTFIRGSTVFEFDNSGLIRKRWSDHDHQFRLSQLLDTPSEIERETERSRVLSGPGLTAQEIRDRMNSMQRIFNQMQNPEKRLSVLSALLSETLPERQIWIEKLTAFFEIMPDAHLAYDAVVAAWSRVGIRWRITGSIRGDHELFPYRNHPISLAGETVLEIDSNGRIASIHEGCIVSRKI